MAIKTAAKLRKKTTKARKRNARTAERQAQLKSKRGSSPTDHLFWVEQGDDLISRSVPFSRQFNAARPERASDRGRWVSRPHLRVGDVLLNRECELVQIVSLPADPKDNPRVRRLSSSAASARRQPPDFCCWLVEGDDLGDRPAARRAPTSPPPRGRPGRWVSVIDLRLNDIVAGASGNLQKVVGFSDDSGTLPVLVPLADCDLYWVVSGPDLEYRSSRFDVPPPASAESGRWISRRHLHVGDALLLERGEFARVINLPESVDDGPRLLHLTRMYEFTLQRPSMITCTPNHPFYVRDRGWTAAGKLQPGDLLLTPTGDWVPVNRVEDLGEIEPVYNLEVEDHHTYFVAGARGGPAVLVHNMCVVSDLPSIADVAPLAAKNPILLAGLNGFSAALTAYTPEQKLAVAIAYDIGVNEWQKNVADNWHSEDLGELAVTLQESEKAAQRIEALTAKFNALGLGDVSIPLSSGTAKPEYESGLPAARQLARELTQPTGISGISGSQYLLVGRLNLERVNESHYAYSEVTGAQNLLIALVQRAAALRFVTNRPLLSNPAFNDYANAIYFPLGTDLSKSLINDIVHESVHAYNSKYGYSSNAEEDERLAYGATFLLINAGSQLQLFQRQIVSGQINTLAAAQEAWDNVWVRISDIVSGDAAYTVSVAGKVVGHTNAADIANIRAKLGLNFSEAELRPIYDKLLNAYGITGELAAPPGVAAPFQ